MAGIDLKTMQETLGHATPNFTLSVYSHVNDDMRKNAAEKMELFLRANSANEV